MGEPRRAIRLFLNDDLVTLDDVAPDATLLDFLRLERGLRGTKEGCAEGDCGACTVLVGRLFGDRVAYAPANACICFPLMLDGTHVVTIEHLRGPDGGLHPVQQAMVEHHGSQCGFCTPGFVMALYALWMSDPDPSVADIETALQGNLCRCTGYAPIVRAARAASAHGGVDKDRLVAERAKWVAALKGLRDGRRVVVESAGGMGVVPADVDDLADVLGEMPEATIVAGATDVGLWVTKFMRDVTPLVSIGHLMGEVTVEADRIVFGAGVSYARALAVFAEHIPQMAELFDRIGGGQVRAMGTLGGNIANGSPIGDTPPPLIALGAEIVLRKGGERRVVRLEDFFIEYGRQDREKGEFVEAVNVPLPGADEIFAVHKVTKRRDEDITATLGAFRIKIAEGRVSGAAIAYGGMAGVPKRARAVEAALVGKAWSRETVEAALPAFETDFQPLTDWRASAEYRMLAAKNLLVRVFLESEGQSVHIVRYEVA